MNRYFLVLLVGIAALMSSCSDDKVTSTSPALGDLTLSPSQLYTGQKATVSVTFSDFGSHVYFSSAAYFLCQINENGRNTDSIPVFLDQDLRVPQNFSFPITLPSTAGTYTLTFRTPTIYKSSTNGEGDALIFSQLTKQKTINVIPAKAINANFSDSREAVVAYITVSDTTFSAPGAFDAAGKASKKSTSADGFVSQIVYKFKENKLAEVDDEISYAITGIQRDENGNTTDVTVNDDDVSKIQKKANELFSLNLTDELLSGDTYDPATAKDTYGTLADNNDTAKWKTFLSDLIKGTTKSYTFKCRHNKTNTMITTVLTANANKILITFKYTE